MPSPPRATVAIISIGQMGEGIARLLLAHGYRVVTTLEGRSAATRARVHAAHIDVLPSDRALVAAADYVLSIAPPRDAPAIAARVCNALAAPDLPARTHPLYYLDLNAISPRSARELDALFAAALPPSTLVFVDGGIIGGPPRVADGADPSDLQAWTRPSMPLSGPQALSGAPVSGAHLADVLNTRHISGAVGGASGLKCCFATTTKGFAALALQALTTAERLGVRGELWRELEMQVPGLAAAAGGVAGVPPKAYRWVREMEEIAATHREDGGFGPAEDVFAAVAGVYRVVAEETDVGRERRKGNSVDEVAMAMVEGLQSRKMESVPCDLDAETE